MAQKQSKGRITIANIIAIVGLVLLLVFSFIGHSYMSGGELGWDIVISVTITAFTAFLLWFLIKAKGAENQLDKWQKIEYATLAVYIIFAIPASLFGGIMHFFVVNDNKESIKLYAKADLDKIDNIFNEYEKFEKDAISRTGIGLRGATRRGVNCDASLTDFMDKRGIHKTEESARTYEEIQKNALIGNNYKVFHDAFRQQVIDIENVVNGWSVLQIPMKARSIEELATSVETEINKLANNENLPEIQRENGRYYIKSYQHKTFSIDGGINSFQFKQALQNASGFSLTAVFFVLLIHILILFNYIVAYRTSTLGISKRGVEDGGRTLN